MDSQEFERLLFQEIKEIRAEISSIRQQLAGYKAKVAILGSFMSIVITFFINYIIRR